MKDEILIDILSSKTGNKILNGMYQCNEFGDCQKTDLFRFVLRETSGYFDLITAYPIYSNEKTDKLANTKQGI